MIQDIILFLDYMDGYAEYLGMQLDMTQLTVTYIVMYSLIVIASFLLKGFGLYKLSKINGIDKEYLSFIPFVSYYQLGRLIGPMSVFRVRIKNFGLVVGILAFAVTVMYNVTAYFRYFDKLETILLTNAVFPVRSGGSIDYDVYTLNEIFYYVCRIIDYANIIFTIFLVMTFFRLYSKQSPFLYALLSVFITPLFGVFVFVVRNNKKGSFYQKIYIDPQSFGGYGGNGYNGYYGGFGGGSPSSYERKDSDNPFRER